MTFDLYRMLDIEFYSMRDLTYSTACGGYINTFKYIAGPLYDSSYVDGADLGELEFELVSIAELKLSVSGVLTDSKWLGQH